MLWGVTSFFNPSGYRRPLHNLQTFAGRVRAQGLPLMIVELALEGADFVVDESWCDQLVRVRSDEVLWHKEALINIGIGRLPEGCDTVAWLDCDVLFDNQEWVAETQTALEQHRVVQPFSHCIWLPPDVEAVDIALTTYPTSSKDYARTHSFGFAWHHFGPHALEARVLYGHVGFAWAARRDILDTLGLYDAGILGSGDDLMAHAFVGPQTMLREKAPRSAPGLLAHYREWADRALAVVNGDVSYVEGTVNHLWHGQMSRRGYVPRIETLRRVDFDPRLHLERQENGLYALRNAPASLATAVRQHFANRMEDQLPEHSAVCHFGEGFHNDEGQFRWVGQRATACVVRHTIAWSITVSNNASHRFVGPQRVTAELNGKQVAAVELPDNSKVDVLIGEVHPGDELVLQAEQVFSPSSYGGRDRRELSFVVWNT